LKVHGLRKPCKSRKVSPKVGKKREGRVSAQENGCSTTNAKVKSPRKTLCHLFLKATYGRRTSGKRAFRRIFHKFILWKPIRFPASRCDVAERARDGGRSRRSCGKCFPISDEVDFRTEQPGRQPGGNQGGKRVQPTSMVGSQNFLRGWEVQRVIARFSQSPRLSKREYKGCRGGLSRKEGNARRGRAIYSEQFRTRSVHKYWRRSTGPPGAAGRPAVGA